ncbi:MAG: hypothetical protein KBC38_03130 [Candidatus Pacebacteria bacterium]|nr:hypothetical protein [Candidatus Paceibacterota bacterium]MBP9840596.1 hypothetical protein [Candidatus Paceibacterota bacterium]
MIQMAYQYRFVTNARHRHTAAVMTYLATLTGCQVVTLTDSSELPRTSDIAIVFGTLGMKPGVEVLYGEPTELRQLGCHDITGDDRSAGQVILIRSRMTDFSPYGSFEAWMTHLRKELEVAVRTIGTKKPKPSARSGLPPDDGEYRRHASTAW